jgi:hypothetical protein
MRAALSRTEYDRFIAHLKARLETEGWVLPDRQLNALAGVLPASESLPEASVVTDTEAAFVLGDTLMVASWKESDEHLTTDLISLAGTPLTMVWNADWLSQYGSGDSDEVPANRPMTVTMRASNGVVYVLPFDAAWSNPVGCIDFASTLILKAHGFRPAVGTANETPMHGTWKR